MLAVVAEGHRERVYVSATQEQRDAADVERPSVEIDGMIADNPRWFSPPSYGMTKFSDLFTNRQLVALTTFSDLVGQARQRVLEDALAAGMEEGESLEAGGSDARAYADAIATYLALAVSRLADYSNSLCTWHTTGEKITHLFTRQAIPMTWDITEANPFSHSSGNFLGQLEWVAKAVERVPADSAGNARQLSADARDYTGLVVSTDPPYYDNIGYSDLSDFFYVWLRRCLQGIHPSVVSTMGRRTPPSSSWTASTRSSTGYAGAPIRTCR